MSEVALSLRGAASLFGANAREETEHAVMLVRWLVSRGGQYASQDVVVADDAPSPSLSPWDAINTAVVRAITVEREVTVSLLQVHQVARECRDVSTADFITKTMLSEQVKALYCLGHLYTRLQRVKDSPIGLLLLDEVLYSEYNTDCIKIKNK